MHQYGCFALHLSFAFALLLRVAGALHGRWQLVRRAAEGVGLAQRAAGSEAQPAHAASRMEDVTAMKGGALLAVAHLTEADSANVAIRLTHRLSLIHI